MSELIEVINKRRSSNNFVEGIEITVEELKEIFELTRMAPSCFNIQHVRYMVILDKEKKELLREAAYKQYKVHTASAAILVLGDTKAYQDAEKIYAGMNSLGIMSDEDFNDMINSIHNLYVGRGESFQRDEAIRNAALSAMMFMLIAKDKGWDTCPMIGFDPEQMKKIFEIPEQYEPVLLITLGKESPKNKRLRGYRKTVEEFVSFDKFNK